METILLYAGRLGWFILWIIFGIFVFIKLKDAKKFKLQDSVRKEIEDDTEENMKTYRRGKVQ